MRTRWRSLVPIIALGLVASACGGDDSNGVTEPTSAPGTDAPSDTDPPDSGDPVEGAAITIALGSEPTSLDPHIVDDGGERAVNDNVYETLLARTPDGELVPSLAVDLPTQIDDTTWEFTLRDDVTFHNGEPFDADSVVATVERMVGLVADGRTDNDGFFSSLTGAEAIDETTVRISTDVPDGVLPARMYWLKQIPASVAGDEDLSDNPVGTGPYTFGSRQQGIEIQLAANPDYWDGVPPVASVTYVFADDSSTRLAGLRSGQYDLITNLAPQDVDQAPVAASIQGQEHPILILDADDGITSDVRVRQALNHAVDKDAIADNLFDGLATVDNGQLLSPSILGHNASLDPYAYDPELAASLLEEAGVVGETIELVGTAGRWLNDRELLEAVAGYWTAAGLEVQLEILEFGAYLDVLFDRENRADSVYVSSSNDILDPDRQLATYYQAGGVGSSNSNADLADLVSQGRSTLDADERQAIYEEAVEIAYDEAYFVWLVNNDDVYGHSESLQWEPRVDAKILVKEMSVTG